MRSGRVFSSASSFTLFARKSASCLSLARISKLLSARLALTGPWMTSSFTFYSWIALPVRRGYKDSIPSKAFHCKMEHSRALASGRALISKSGLGLGGVFLFSLFQFLFSIFWQLRPSWVSREQMRPDDADEFAGSDDFSFLPELQLSTFLQSSAYSSKFGMP